MIKKLLNENSEFDIVQSLKKTYRDQLQVSDEDKRLLDVYLTEDYALLGVIGLIIGSKARILLGRKQPYDHDISSWCNSIRIDRSELERIANLFLDDDFTETEEVVFRKVMLEYPNGS